MPENLNRRKRKLDKQEPKVTDGTEQTTPEVLADKPDVGGEIPAPDNNDSIAQNEGAAQEAEKSAQDPPAAEDKPPAQTKRGGKPPISDKAAKPKDPEYEKALKKYEKELAEYKKELAEWESKEPWERESNPPKPPQRPKSPKKEKEKADGKQQPAAKGKTTAKEEAAPPAPAEPEPPPPPIDATRSGEVEQIVYLNLTELRPFKDHPFEVRDDAEMRSLVDSVKDGGVNNPAIVRPHPDGGYELIEGHRRQKASELANYTNMPCIIRNMTDEEAILAMTDSNLRQRENILPSEKAWSLKMQVDAIKRQGVRTSGQDGAVDKVS